MRGTNDPEDKGARSEVRDVGRASPTGELGTDRDVRRSRELWDAASAKLVAAFERVIRQSVAKVLGRSPSPERKQREDTPALRDLLLQERSQLLDELDGVRLEEESLRREVLQARENLAVIERLRLSAEETVRALLRDFENLRSQWCPRVAPLEQPRAKATNGSTGPDNPSAPAAAVLPDALDRRSMSSSEHTAQESKSEEGDRSGSPRSSTTADDRTSSSDNQSSPNGSPGPKRGLATATTSLASATGPTVEPAAKAEPRPYSPLAVPRSTIVPVSTAPDFTSLDTSPRDSNGASSTGIIMTASELFDAVADTPRISELDLKDPHLVRALVAMADAREGYDRGHSDRVRAYAVAAACELLLDERQIATLEMAALLRDIGFVRIPSQVVMKSGLLSQEEWELIRRHPTLGVSIIKALPRMEAIVPIVLQHHERYDGRGYPEGLPGSDTHILAQILSIAEAYAAMTSPRPYRPPLTSEQAVEELRKGAGSQFHPILVEVFIKATRAAARDVRR